MCLTLVILRPASNTPGFDTSTYHLLCHYPGSSGNTSPDYQTYSFNLILK